MIDIFTIGFAGKSAEDFFTRLKSAGVKRVLDIRLKNTSHLAGFAKKDDLRFFLREVAGIEYVQLLELAPTEEILDGFKKNNGDWAVYERSFLELMDQRKPAETLDRDVLNSACLLCSEDKHEHCHRRLVAEYLQRKWRGVRITHL